MPIPTKDHSKLRRLRDALARGGVFDEWRSDTELARVTKLSLGEVRDLLHALIEAGEAERYDGGRSRGRPRYRIKEKS